MPPCAALPPPRRTGGGGKPDWDAAWKDFVTVRQTTLAPALPRAAPRCASLTPRALFASPRAQRAKFDPEQYVDRPAAPKGWGGAARDDIRKAERSVLAAWTSPTFAKAGVLIVLLTLFVFVVVIGPPPSDGRCTLPWCG